MKTKRHKRHAAIRTSCHAKVFNYHTVLAQEIAQLRQDMKELSAFTMWLVTEYDPMSARKQHRTLMSKLRWLAQTLLERA